VLFAFTFDFASVLPLAAFGLFAAGAWFIMELVIAQKSRQEERLEEFQDPTIRRRKENGSFDEGSAMGRMLEKAAPSLAKPLQPKNEDEAIKLKDKLSYAGFRGESASTVFLGIKFASLLVGLMMAAGTIAFWTGINQSGLMRAGAIACMMFFLPSIVLWYLGKKRKEQIFLGLPDALDLLVVCVEAGLGLDQAMRKVAEEMKKTYRIISEEFGLCNFQLQMGRTRTEALHELGQRTGVADLRSLASIIVQADKFGSSVAQALRVQSDAMRTRRQQMAEEKAAKTAVKLIFPLVIFIFPGIFVVLVGPAAITMMREMFPMMNGG